MIQNAGLSCIELGSFCRKRGLYPSQVVHWPLMDDRIRVGNPHGLVISDQGHAGEGVAG